MRNNLLQKEIISKQKNRKRIIMKQEENDEKVERKFSTEDYKALYFIYFYQYQISDPMNSKQGQRNIQQLSKIEEQTNQHKTFEQSIFKIHYTNTSQVLFKNQGNFVDDVEVKNYLCYQDGRKLCKMTEICYEDKIIRITDTFEIQVDESKMADKQNPQIKLQEYLSSKQKINHRRGEKVRIFKKQINKNGKVERKDKKNIVKNIIKMFLSWLSNKSHNLYQEALQALKGLLKKQNFNNRLIKEIIALQGIKKPFLEFLSEYAESQIENSRIQDKQSHYQAIDLYIKLITGDKNKNGQVDLSENSHNLNNNSQIHHLQQNSKVFPINNNLIPQSKFPLFQPPQQAPKN